MPNSNEIEIKTEAFPSKKMHVKVKILAIYCRLHFDGLVQDCNISIANALEIIVLH